MYVDDIILTGTDSIAIDAIKSHLHSEFSIKGLGKLSYFWGIEVTHDVSSGLLLTQKKLTSSLLQQCGLDLSKKAVTPLPLN